MQRRQFLSVLPLAAAALTAPATARPPRSGTGAATLRAGNNGVFRILSYSDLHYGPAHDPASQKLIRQLIAAEKPDLILINGDCIAGETCKTEADVHDAVAQVAAAPEAAALPWAVTMGNHDRNQSANTGLSDEAFFCMFEAYPHNINAGWEQGITGLGNTLLQVWNAKGDAPLFHIWLMDSGTAAKDKSLHYDWVQPDQIAWLLDSEDTLEQRYGPVPSLLFCHIPVREFAELSATGKISGTHGQKEDTSAINGGLFAATLKKQNILGIFCGHDHMNNYLGSWHGVTLGFDGSAGLKHAYPKMATDDPRQQKMRGGRIFEIRADHPGTVHTHIRHMDGTAEWDTVLTRKA